ncbi:hypothetical protein GGX14DRAFT_385581 [Mycena pura]|uniref:RNase H type-1 domain-containing protein n=1 Tax=Mycena pura TaxID=153505 RepID=A0AAD6YQP8_9AGAR|nr:hypothetical protein GGX14DRAFT_385581 [Mycena pura]
MATRLGNPAHLAQDTCDCTDCENDRDMHCENPHACATKAASRLRQIHPRWIPGSGEPEREPGPAGQSGSPDDDVFVPPSEIMDISQGLRTMTNRRDEPVERPVIHARRRMQALPRAQNSVVHIAGTIYTQPGEKPIAAAAFSMEGEAHERMGKRIPAASNQLQYVAEFFAALAALRSVAADTVLTIYSAQPYVRDAMNKKLQRWEHEGWIGVQHRDILRCVAAELKARKAPTYFRLAEPGTPARAACRRAARLAKRAARSTAAAEWDMALPPNTALPGLSLQGNRQRTFYRGIREEKTKKLAPRASTERNLQTIREAAYEAFERHVSNADIWSSISVKELLPRPAQFLWKGVHNALKIGSFWTHIPECEDPRGVRRLQRPGGFGSHPHTERETEWPEVSLGTVLGCGLAEFRDGQGKINQGAPVIPDLDIRLRNERVIDRAGRLASEEEIERKFKFVINQRLQMDKVLANRPRKGKRPALPAKLVLATWSGILDDAHSLPADWLREPRVLVGSRSFPPRTPSRQSDSQGIG